MADGRERTLHKKIYTISLKITYLSIRRLCEVAACRTASASIGIERTDTHHWRAAADVALLGRRLIRNSGGGEKAFQTVEVAVIRVSVDGSVVDVGELSVRSAVGAARQDWDSGQWSVRRSGLFTPR